MSQFVDDDEVSSSVIGIASSIDEIEDAEK